MSEDIKVGDWVRWSRTRMPDLWAEGELTAIHNGGSRIDIRVSSSCRTYEYMDAGSVHRFDGPLWSSASVVRVRCSQPADPLDVEYDGVTLRTLLDRDRLLRTDHPGRPKSGDWSLTPAQRAAVSAHWSAELRTKVRAAKERERCVVTYAEWEPGE